MKKLYYYLLVETFIFCHNTHTITSTEKMHILNNALIQVQPITMEYVRTNPLENVINMIFYVREAATMSSISSSLSLPSSFTPTDRNFIAKIKPFVDSLVQLEKQGEDASFRNPVQQFYEMVINKLSYGNSAIQAVLATLPSLDSFLKQASAQDKAAFKDFIEKKAHINTATDPFELLSYQTFVADTPLIALCKLILQLLRNAGNQGRPDPRPNMTLIINNNNRFTLTELGNAYLEYVKKYFTTRTS